MTQQTMIDRLKTAQVKIISLEQTIGSKRRRISDLEEIRTWERGTEQMLVKALQDVYDLCCDNEDDTEIDVQDIFEVACFALVRYTKRIGPRPSAAEKAFADLWANGKNPTPEMDAGWSSP